MFSFMLVNCILATLSDPLTMNERFYDSSSELAIRTLTEPTLSTSYPFPDSSGIQIVGQASNLCLDVVDGSSARWARTEIWPCNGGYNQKWDIVSTSTAVNLPDGKYPVFQIKSKQSGKCLTLLKDAVTVVQDDCYFLKFIYTQGTLWYAQQEGDNTFSLVNRKYGRCVSVQNGATGYGAQAVLNDCVHGGNQKWTSVK